MQSRQSFLTIKPPKYYKNQYFSRNYFIILRIYIIITARVIYIGENYENKY